MRVHINNISEMQQIKTFDFNLYDFVYFEVNVKYNKLQILDIKQHIHYYSGYDLIKKRNEKYGYI